MGKPVVRVERVDLHRDERVRLAVLGCCLRHLCCRRAGSVPYTSLGLSVAAGVAASHSVVR